MAKRRRCCCSPSSPPPNDADYPCHCERAGESPVNYNRRYPKRMTVQIAVEDAPYPVAGDGGGQISSGAYSYATNMFDFAVGTYVLDFSANCSAYVEVLKPGTLVFASPWVKDDPYGEEVGTVRISASEITLHAGAVSSQMRACDYMFFGVCGTNTDYLNTRVFHNGSGGLNQHVLPWVCDWGDSDSHVAEIQKTANWPYGYMASWCGCSEKPAVVNEVHNVQKFTITRTIEWHTFS